MEIGMISFTARGAGLCCRLAEELDRDGKACTGYVPKRFWNTYCKEPHVECLEQSLAQWTKAMFDGRKAMVFVGAAGIAVRAISPFVRDKMTDPPVVVVDEAGRFAIPVLSGHVGGANELARRIADILHGTPVITTATDVNGLFAVDVFAARNHLLLTDRDMAKQVSAWLLDGGKVGFLNDFDYRTEDADTSCGFCAWGGAEPGGIQPLPRGCVRELCEYNIWITVKCRWSKEAAKGAPMPDARFLRLVPKAVTAGVGCRRGIPFPVLEQQVKAAFERYGIDVSSVKALATIDVKKDEPALLALAGRYGWELRFYSAEELAAVQGDFRESAFVKQTVGVGNVCERACVAGGGRLLFGKEAGDGVTVAAAVESVPLAGAVECPERVWRAPN